MSAETEHDRIDAEIIRVTKSSDPFASAVRATRMPMLITDPNLPDNPIVFANNAFLRLTGYAREEVVGRNCRFLQGPETDPADVKRLRDAIARRAQIEMEIINHRKDGSRFHNRVLISPVFDEDGHLTYFFASQFDVTLERDRMVRLQEEHDKLELDVERRTRELRLSEERLRSTMQAARVGSWTLDLSEMRLSCSTSASGTSAGSRASHSLTSSWSKRSSPPSASGCSNPVARPSRPFPTTNTSIGS